VELIYTQSELLSSLRFACSLGCKRSHLWFQFVVLVCGHHVGAAGCGLVAATGTRGRWWCSCTAIDTCRAAVAGIASHQRHQCKPRSAGRTLRRVRVPHDGPAQCPFTNRLGCDPRNTRMHSSILCLSRSRCRIASGRCPSHLWFVDAEHRVSIGTCPTVALALRALIRCGFTAEPSASIANLLRRKHGFDQATHAHHQEWSD
jgi:hypothetical protein